MVDLEPWRQEVRLRLAGHSWPGWAALLALWAWLSIGPMLSNHSWSPVLWLSVAVHEAGHMVTLFWAPTFVSVAAGTGFQWGAPVLCGWLLWRQGEALAVPICLIWLGMSLGMSVDYIASASLNDVSNSISVGYYNANHDGIHDWNYMLTHLGLLRFENAISGLCRLASIATMLVGMACGAWMLWEMRRSARPGG